MPDKIFIGRCKPGKYPDQIDIGFTQKDIDALQNNLNDKGWVNARVNKSREKGNPYMEIIPAQ